MMDREMNTALRLKLKQNFLPQNFNNENIRRRAVILLMNTARDRDFNNRQQRSEQEYRRLAEEAIRNFCATCREEEGLGNRFGSNNSLYKQR